MVEKLFDRVMYFTGTKILILICTRIFLKILTGKKEKYICSFLQKKYRRSSRDTDLSPAPMAAIGYF